jgi:hypothetical protein
MEGSMDIETGGLRVTLQRTSDGRLPMKNFSAILTGTGEPYPDLYPDTAGRTLTGASEEVFERSAFISQAGVKISQTPELEKRITSLVATGDETVSYTETDERLRAWMRKRRFNKTGTIPALEDKLTGLTKQLSHIEAALDDAASIRLEAERLKRRHDELSEELRRCDRYESTRSLQRAREEYERAKAVYDGIYKELTKNGRVPTEAGLGDIRGDMKALESLDALRVSEQKRMTETRSDYEALLQRKDVSPFSGRDASHDEDEAVGLERDIHRYAIRHQVSVMLMLLTSAFIALSAALPDFRLYAAALALITALLLIRRLLRHRSLRGRLDRLLILFGAESADALAGQYQTYSGLLAELAEAESAFKSAEKSVFSAAENCRSVRNGLAAKLEAAGLYGEPEIAAREIYRIETLMEKLAAAKAEVKAAEGIVNALKETGKAAGCEDAADIPEPVRSRREVGAELGTVTARLEDMTNRYNMALGEVRALGDPVILGSERIAAEEALTVQMNQYDALSLAVDTLREASLELQSRFAPLLGETAGRIMARLTAGRYEKLAFDKALEASARTRDETVSRSVLSLSMGTADQIYLALRLAVCRLILPEENACPLILDDTLCNFDDARAYLALDYLKELSRARQVLLFTCHRREADRFRGSGEVNIISL